MERYKTGGRLKGTPNRLTKQSKEILAEIVNNEIDNLPALMDQLEPRERAYILTKLLPYILPKAEGTQIEQDPPITIVIPPNI